MAKIRKLQAMTAEGSSGYVTCMLLSKICVYEIWRSPHLLPLKLVEAMASIWQFVLRISAN